MKRQFVTAILFVFFGLALTAESAEKDLFAPSYIAQAELDWGLVVLRAEPIEFKISTPHEAIMAQAVSPVPRNSVDISVRLNGIGYNARLVRASNNARGSSWWIHLEGEKSLSHYTTAGKAVAGELWNP